MRNVLGEPGRTGANLIILVQYGTGYIPYIFGKSSPVQYEYEYDDRRHTTVTPCHTSIRVPWAHNYFSGIGKFDGCIAE